MYRIGKNGVLFIGTMASIGIPLECQSSVERNDAAARRWERRALVALAIAFWGIPPVAMSQSPALISGRVVDSTGRAVSGALIEVPQLPQLVRADSAGAFRLSGLAAGRYVLRVRSVGFAPVDTAIDTKQGEASSVRIVLARSAVPLDTVAIAGLCEARRFSGFACRRSAGVGVFLDVTAIDSSDARDVKQLFWNRAGFRLTPRGIEATSHWRCLNVLVNGELPSPSNPLPPTPRHLIGVEIYVNPDEIPAQYARFAYQRRRMVEFRCTLVVYWTTIRQRPKPTPDDQAVLLVLRPRA